MIPILPANGGGSGFRPFIPATGQPVPIWSNPVRPIPVTPILRPIAPGQPTGGPVAPNLGNGGSGAPQGGFGVATPTQVSPSTQQSSSSPAPIVTGSSDTISSTAGPNPTEAPTVAQVGGLSPWLLVAGAALVLLLLVRR